MKKITRWGMIIGGFLAFLPLVAHATIPGNIFQYTPPNPPSIGSTTVVNLGIGLANSFMPRADGIALITINGTVAQQYSNDGAKLAVVYGTGTPPAITINSNGNGASATGTACGNALQTAAGASGGSQAVPFAISCVATGMALNQGYWFDLQVATTGTASTGTVTLSGIGVSVVEE